MGDRILGSQGKFRPAPSEYGTYFDVMRRQWPGNALRFGSSWSAYAASLQGKDGDDDFPSGLDSAELAGSDQKYYAAIGPHACGRTFCLTARGYMGLVPPKSKVGDPICLLFGSQVPFVFLQVPPEHMPEIRVLDGQGPAVLGALAGECYVHGIMDGEALNQGLQHRDIFVG